MSGSAFLGAGRGVSRVKPPVFYAGGNSLSELAPTMLDELVLVAIESVRIMCKIIAAESFFPLDVSCLNVRGWLGGFELLLWKEPGMRIYAPVRAIGEYWYFSGLRSGKMSLLTNMAWRPRLIKLVNDPETGQPWPLMQIFVPANRSYITPVTAEDYTDRSKSRTCRIAFLPK